MLVAVSVVFRPDTRLLFLLSFRFLSIANIESSRYEDDRFDGARNQDRDVNSN